MTRDGPLAGRVAVVTGASRGIGHAIARALYADGARVAVCARTKPALEELVRSLGPDAHSIPLDLTGADSGSTLITRAEAALGPVELVVHAAAPLFDLKRVMQLGDDEIDRALATSVAVMAGMARAAVPSMLGARYGRFVVVGSMAATHGAAGSAMYSAAKAGLTGLMNALAVDHGRHGITANTVQVAFADTERFRGRTTPESRARFEQATALRRIPSPEEVASVVAFVCGPRAGIITGSVLWATAGAHLNTLW